MIVSVPVMSQDVTLTDDPDIGRWMSLADWFVMKGEEPYYDGPVSRRVAVVDLDHRTGALRPGARFDDGRPRGETSKYVVEEGDRDEWGVGEIARIEADAFLQTSVFGTVVKTLKMFERAPMLGRRLTWGFGREQLLVVPRAGDMANAFYDRDTGSLQFFSVPTEDPDGRPIHTALSHDVVAHETAHAVLDGICPELYDAITPQARALHETFADVTSLLASLGDVYRLRMELDLEGRSLRSSTTFGRLAEQLGQHLGAAVGADALRDANNACTLDPDDNSHDRHGRPNFVGGIAAHDLSMVMTGAIYGVFRRLAQAERKRLEGGIPRSLAKLELGPVGLGAHLAAQRVARSVARARAHLPPGETSFADFGRAFLVADRLDHPRSPEPREWLVGELLARAVVERRDDLDVPASWPDLEGWDGPSALSSSAEARRLVSRNRALLGIPDKARYAVRTYDTGRGQVVVRVTWQVKEDNAATRDLAPERSVATGTTLVAETSTGRVLSLLASDSTADPRQVADRGRMLRWLADEDLLVDERDAVGPDGRPLREPIVARAVRGTMRLSGGARMVHCIGLPGLG